MDENVVFTNKDTTQAGDTPNTPEAATDATPQVPVSDQSVSDVPAADQPPTEEATSDEPPSDLPPPPGGFLSGGMIKKIIIGVVVLIIIIFIIFLLIPKKQAPKNVKLVWWGLWEDSRTVQPLIDSYHKDHPNVQIEYIKQNPEKYRDRLLARIQNGTGPDIFRFHNTWVPMLSETLLPLPADVISPDDFKKNYYKVMQTDLISNGAIYGLPMEADSLALFVNTALLEKANVQAPNTWEDFVKAACKLTVKDTDTKTIKTAGAALGIYGNVTHAPDIISLLFIQQGVNIKDFTSTKAKAVDALDFYTKFSTSVCAGGDNQNVWDIKQDPSILAFSKGNLAMYIGYSWDVFQIQELNKQMNKNVDFKIYPVPGLEGGNNPTIASYWVEGVSAKSPNQKEALLFMKYLSLKDTAQKFYTQGAKSRLFGEPYARIDLGETLKDNALAYPFISQLPYASSSYFVSSTYDGEGGLNTSLNAYLGTAVNSIVNDAVETNEVVGILIQGIAQVYEKYAIQLPQ